jgi:probable HAF family extracellular repeat protein
MQTLRYRLQLIAPPSESKTHRVMGLNDQGMVLIMVTTTPDTPADQWYLWQNGQFTAINLPGKVKFNAVGPDDQGVVYCWAEERKEGYLWHRLFSWKAGKATEIPAPSGWESVFFLPQAVSGRGEVVGTADFKISPIMTVGSGVFSLNRGRANSLDKQERPNSEGSGVNNRGQAVGSFIVTEPTILHHAALFSGGNITDLGTLGGRNSYAYGINTAGEVVGASEYNTEGGTIGMYQQAFLYKNRKITNLGTLGGPQSQALAINDLGTIIGKASTKLIPNVSPSQFVPVIWKEGKIYSLKSLTVNWPQNLSESQDESVYIKRFYLNNKNVIAITLRTGGTTYPYIFTPE